MNRNWKQMTANMLVLVSLASHSAMAAGNKGSQGGQQQAKGLNQGAVRSAQVTRPSANTQTKIAVGSGGTSGKGWRQGTQTGLRFLPEQHTDFIFSVFAEEQGFWWCLMLLALYGVMLIGCLVVAGGAKDRFGVFACVGIAAMVFWQVFENIGMVSGLMPITGITLPLMSYGGSSMLSVMLGVGLVVNISMQRGK